MQRYLQEPQSSYFIASSNIDTPGTRCTGIYPDMSCPPHQSSQVRQGSPMSYQPSSAASGPQSPNWTDNDAHVSTLGPSTPSDVAVLSPNIVGSGSLSPSVSLYGLSSVPQRCVNPAVIAPSQTVSGIKEEQEINAFTLDMNANFDGATPSSIYQGDSSSSPSTFDPSSLELYPQADTKAAYPDPDNMDLDVNFENEAETIDGDDGDDEYRPNCRTKSSRNAKGGSRRGRTRRLSSTTNASRGKVTKSRTVTHDLPPDWLAQEKKLQEEAFRQRCKLPDYMHCPAKGCTKVFNNGHKTWDDRMEHVAVHLERAAKNEEPHVVFGGTNDEALTEWASHPNVRVIASTSGGWETCQPLKAAKTELSRLTSVHDEGLG
ncbi:hypothetical protein FoTM2_005749 [Fusarium oxysporum f. sp. vasinfectum]|nr:hypothetical protein FoTM2_005749 [Fusarium oxysporum f. sp. vasinfectum]